MRRLSALKSQPVLRGGDWKNNPNNLRSAKRNRNTPDNRNNNNGFRIARTAQGQSVPPFDRWHGVPGVCPGALSEVCAAHPLWLISIGSGCPVLAQTQLA